MNTLDPYILIIGCSIIVLLSFLFGEFSRKTNVPSVLLLIGLGIGLKAGLDAFGYGEKLGFESQLEILGIVGLIMIVLEAALELKLRRDKLLSIGKALLIALICLLGSSWLTALILEWRIEGMTTLESWIYATPLAIISSAIAIPSVNGLSEKKREFSIYDSTFSDILGIMQFYFLLGLQEKSMAEGATDFSIGLLITVGIAVTASYAVIFLFQNIKTSVKLILLISILLLLYSIGKMFHLSSLIIILVFGLTIANIRVFFRGRLGKWLDFKQANRIYDGLHVITGETAFIVRTFFFVIFGVTIVLSHLQDLEVAQISGLIILVIYAVRLVTLLVFVGKDILPQLFIAPRGLITILLFNSIPVGVQNESFEPGILLYVIIFTALIMTAALIWDKQRTGKSMRDALAISIGYTRYKAPTVESLAEKDKSTHGGESAPEGAH